MASSSKEILIKLVAQAIPTYVMSVFKLPYSVCDDLTRMMRTGGVSRKVEERLLGFLGIS